MLRRLLAAIATAAAIMSALAGAAARAADGPTIRHTFPVPGAFTATAKTAGAANIVFTNGGPADGCHELAVDIKVDGGAAQTYVVRAGGSISPLIAPQRRGERTIEVQARLNRACAPPAGLQGALSIFTSADLLAKGQLSFVDRTNALKRALHGPALSIALRRNGVEKALDPASDRTYRALEQKHVITDKQIQVNALHRTIARRLEYLYRVPAQPVRLAQDQIAAIRSIGHHLADLESRAVAAARGGGQHRVFDARIKQLRAHLLVLESKVDAQRWPGVTKDARAVRTELNRLAAMNHDLRIAQAQAEREKTQAEDVLRRLADSRAALDSEAFDLWTQLATLDVDVREVRVTANGRLVFHLRGNRAQYEHVRELQASIDEAERALAEAEQVRKQHAARFYANQRTVIAAEAELAEEIWAAGRWHALIDGAFHAYDLTDAFVKGGPIALVGVAAQKLIEQRIADYLRPPGSVEPGSIEEEINRRYRAGLSETITTERMGYMAVERLGKDTLGKASRDAFGQVLAQKLFSQVDTRLTPGNSGISAWPRLPSLAEVKEWRNAQRTFAHLGTQMDNLKKGFRADKFWKNLGKNMGKDIVKAGLKRWVDEVQEQAWVAFFEADVVARASYPAYAAAKDHEWKVYDGLQRLLERKRQLLEAGWDMRGYTTPVTEQFPPDAQLEVQVQAVGLVAGDTPLAVYIGKTAVPFASRSGETFVYRISASQLEAGTQDTLTIG